MYCINVANNGLTIWIFKRNIGNGAYNILLKINRILRVKM